jgi:hypothetical protein
MMRWWLLLLGSFCLAGATARHVSAFSSYQHYVQKAERVAQTSLRRATRDRSAPLLSPLFDAGDKSQGIPLSQLIWFAFLAGWALIGTPYVLSSLPALFVGLYAYRNKSVAGGSLALISYIKGMVFGYTGAGVLYAFLGYWPIAAIPWLHSLILLLIGLTTCLIMAVGFGVIALPGSRSDTFVDSMAMSMTMFLLGIYASLLVAPQKTPVVFGMISHAKLLSSTRLLGVFSYVASFATGLAMLPVCVGIGVVFSLPGVARADFFKDLSVLAGWLALYVVLPIVRPFVYFWHYWALFAFYWILVGFFYWMQTSREIIDLHFDRRSSQSDNDSSWWGQAESLRMVNPRILAKRLFAVLAFVMFGFCGLESYLFYKRVTLQQAVIRTIKSL